MKKIVFVSIVFILLSCTSNKRTTARTNSRVDTLGYYDDDNYKIAYINEFKLFYFQSCLKHGFDNNEAINTLSRIDNSGFAEPILGMTYKTIDSLAKLEYKKMYRAENEVAEGGAGMHVYSTCLEAYTSKWLDSLARAEYEKQR